MHYLKKELYERMGQDEHLFDFIQEAALDGLWYWDLEQMDKEWMNSKFWTTLGYDPEQMPHTPDAWQNIVFSEDFEETKAMLQAHLQNPEANPYDQIIRYRHKEGHTVWIRCRGKAILDSNNKPIRILGAHTDVTEVKQMEARYRQQSRFYRSLIETQTSYVCRLDFEANYLFINTRLAEDFKLPKPREGQPVPARRMLSETEELRLRDICRRLLEGHEKQTHAYLQSQRADGRVARVYWEFTLIYSEAGIPLEIQGVGLDLTSETEARDTLQKANQFLEDAQRMARLGTWEKNLRTGEERWSAMVYEIHEVPDSFNPATDLRHELGFYAHGPGRKQLQQAVTQCLRSGTPFDVEAEILTTRQNRRWVRVVGNADFHQHKAVRLYGTIQDINERKQNEQRLIEAEKKAQKQGRLLKAAAESNARLNQSEWEEALPECLELFGKALDVDRTYYFAVRASAPGEASMEMQYEWTSQPELAVIDNPAYKYVALDQNHEQLLETFSSGKALEAIVSDMPQGPTRRMFEEQNIKTIFSFPVFADAELIGVLGFDDCQRERRIAPEERELIESFASSLGRSMLLQQKQRQLKASEIKLRSLINSSTENIILLSPDYKVLMLNRAANEAVEKYYNGKHLQPGDDVRPFILPDALDYFYDAIQRAAKGERVEIEFEADFGIEKQWMRFTYFPVYHSDGSLMGISFSSVNIDQRKRAEEQLRASEERLRGLLESQTNYLIRTDLLGNYTYANQNFRDSFYFLHGDEELIGRSSMESIIEEDRQMVINKVMHLIEHPKDILQFEIRKPVVGDKAMTSLWEFSCITDAQGRPVEIQCIGLDITDRKKDQQQLQQHEAYQRSLLKAMPDPLFVLSTDGYYLDYNARPDQLFCGPERFIGKHLQEFFPAPVARRHEEAIETVRKTAKPADITYSLDIEGKTEHFKARLVTLSEDKIILSVSNETQAVNNLNRIKALLRTEEEQNKRLRNFTHIVSHNLRNHTANIQGVLSVLEMDYPDIYQHEYIGMLKKTSDNLSETIKHLNEVLDIKLNKPGRLSRQNLWEVLETTADSVRQLARDAGVEVRNELPKTLYINTIPAYLHSIVLNMLTNSIKYKSDETPESYVRIGSRMSEKWLHLVFEDNGMGIDLNKYGSKLFGMYKTFHHHKDSRGLGLFITKNQVEALGGHIEVESEVGKGSRFTVLLPVHTVPEPPDSAP